MNAEYAIEFCVIFSACICAELFVIWVQKMWDKRLDIGCDYCEEVGPLSRTPDKIYLCRKCMPVYLNEHPFTEEQRQKALRGFRKRQRNKHK